MNYNISKTFIIFFILSFFISFEIFAQEFPIAVGSDTTFPGGGAFDGTNYLMGIAGDSLSKNSVTAQFFDQNGKLVGSRISLGKKGGDIRVAFDGTNYLLVWQEYNWNPLFSKPYDTTSIYGQFLSTSGNFIGNTFNIAIGISLIGDLVYNNNEYLLTYLKGGKHINYLYGQRMNKTGAAISAPIKISSNYARESSIAYDGANYLVGWVEGSGWPNDRIIYGQFLSNSGNLVGSNFVIDGGSQLSDNPISIAFDGTKYLVAFHEQSMDTSWNLYARFVSTSGVVDSKLITICDSSKHPFLPSVAFDGTNYLITWVNMFGEKIPIDSIQIIGRFYNKSGTPIDSAFSIFKTKGGKFPLGGVAGFRKNQLIVGAVRVDSNNTNGDIYVVFISRATLKITNKEPNELPISIYPNPASDKINLRIDKFNGKDFSLKIYDAAGCLVKSDWLKQSHNQIDVKDLSNGIYFLEMESNEWMGKQKLLIEK